MVRTATNSKTGGVTPCQFDSDLSNLERQLLVKEAPSTEGALLFKRHGVKAHTTTWYWPRRLS